MKAAVFILLCCFSLCAGYAQTPLPTGQYLLTENGTIQCTVKETDDVVAIHPEPVLTIQDFKEAAVGYEATANGNRPLILIKLQPSGQRKFLEFSRRHLGERSGTVIDGELYTAIVMTTALDVHYLEVSTKGSPREIRKLVRSLNRSIRESQ